jgi:hypothetical protein
VYIANRKTNDKMPPPPPPPRPPHSKTTYINLFLNNVHNFIFKHLWQPSAPALNTLKPLGQNRLIQAMQINEEKLSILDNQVLNANGPIYHSQIVA